MIFDSQEDAEKSYMKLAKAYMEGLVGHQIMTSFYIGCFEGAADVIEKKLEKGDEPTQMEVEHAGMLQQVLYLRKQELMDMMKQAPDNIPMPSIDHEKLSRSLEKRKEYARSMWATMVDKPDRDKVMADLMATIEKNKAEMGLDDESPEA